MTDNDLLNQISRKIKKDGVDRNKLKSNSILKVENDFFQLINQDLIGINGLV